VPPSAQLFTRACVWALLLGGAACDGDDAPENPTWGDVEPILRAECGHCHGATAGTTGGGFRFDFYDLASGPCADAASVLADVGSARVQANTIAQAITSMDEDVRPIMPPLPAPYLSEKEWLTILRWAANPIKGDKPPNNQAPWISIDGTSRNADETLDVNVVVHDPEGDPVVGLIKIGDQVGKMDRSGAFAGRYDTSSWPAGPAVMSAELCDGWSRVSVDLVVITIEH
jgi:hypothetical protein